MQRREAQKIRTIQDINNDRSSTYYDDETDSDDEYYAKKKLDSEFKRMSYLVKLLNYNVTISQKLLKFGKES